MEKAMQRESIDDELKNRLWSAMKLAVWDNWSRPDFYGHQSDDARRVEHLVEVVWLKYFKAPIDTIPNFESDHPRSAYQVIRDYFFKAAWWEAYDFLEFLVKATDNDWSKSLIEFLNSFLQQENAAYRIVDSEVVEITSEHEVEAIESAIQMSTKSMRQHFTRALELLSDRRNPDYRNSIKESISAVESVCQSLAGNPKGTLGDCLKLLKSKAPIHPALEGAFLKLYGYTSNGGGIRHALTEESVHPSFADAKFMLVACSSFVSFLFARAAELGIKLPRD